MNEPGRSSSAGIVAMLGVAGLAVLCCAGPVLVAGGVVSVIGGAVRSPWLIAAGAVLVVAAAGYTVARHRRRGVRDGAAGSVECCPPQARAEVDLSKRETHPEGPVEQPRSPVDKDSMSQRIDLARRVGSGPSMLAPGAVTPRRARRARTR